MAAARVQHDRDRVTEGCLDQIDAFGAGLVLALAPLLDDVRSVELVSLGLELTNQIFVRPVASGEGRGQQFAIESTRLHLVSFPSTKEKSKSQSP